MTSIDLAYAKDVKQALLDSPKLFVPDHDLTTIWFEKEIADNSREHTIADCLIFSMKQGLIGVEIKSARDSKKRLRRQLKDYSKVCDYVWVLIHDLMLPEVNDILEDYPHVGIMCYSEVNLGTLKIKPWLAIGVVKRPTKSPTFSLRLALDMLWSEELYELAKRMAKRKGKPILPKYQLSRKKERINFILRMGEQYAHDSFMELITSGYKAPERRFADYDFKRKRS